MKETQTEILARINELMQALQEGKLDQLAMEELTTCTRELHERILILRYKSFEEKVFENKKEDTISTSALEEKIEPVKETKENFAFDFSNEESEQKQAAVDFSIFDQEKPAPEEKKTNTFDPTKVKEEPEVELKPEPEEKQVSILEQIDEEKFSSFHDKFAKTEEDNSFGGQFGASKIESLATAFGFNDKLIVINDLFGGNSQDFETAINVLDTQNSVTDARQKLSEIAVSREWDLESEIVADFEKKVERRYA